MNVEVSLQYPYIDLTIGDQATGLWTGARLTKVEALNLIDDLQTAIQGARD